jgi:signal transduction histidine kinase
LPDRLRGYNVETVLDVASAETVMEQAHPDAVIAPITAESLRFFGSLDNGDHRVAHPRPLRVLITETPRSGFPADLVLPQRWLDQQLLGTLKLRDTVNELRAKLDEEIGNFEAARARDAKEIDLIINAIVRTVSHELKTPLLHVKTAVTMLSQDSEKDRSKLISYATEATARLEGVIMNVTRLNDIHEIKLEPTPFAHAVDLAIRNLRRSWVHKDNADRVAMDIPKDLPLVWADEQAIASALQLLIDNGLKFSEKPVEVSARVFDGYMVISVRDHGIGIPQDKFEKIFDAFYQVENTDVRRFGGMGVGLAIVRLILSQHRAFAKVESEVGVGSTFSFALPCVE